MPPEIEKDYRIKVFQKGQVVIPIGLRRRYGINIGDQVDAVPTADGILIRPDPSRSTSASGTDRLFGIFTAYRDHLSAEPTREEIADATETGFAREWPK